MNKTYTNNDNFISNNGIYDALYGNSPFEARKRGNRLDALLCKLIALMQILTGATARRLARVSGVVLSLVAIVGIVGAMETGRLPLWSGILLSVLFLGIEYLCLRPSRRRSN